MKLPIFLLFTICCSLTTSAQEQSTEKQTILKEVAITAEKPGVSLKLDKKIFVVGKDLLSQNGSANDLLNNLPAVAVSPTGTVSLRGNSNVLILINGRKTGLTQSNALDQIPAGQIDRVEIITNPSARYDAAGNAGIINIILKKNNKGGFTGQVKLVGGLPNDTRLNPSLNYKSDKINLFSTFGFRSTDYVGLYRSEQLVEQQDLGTAQYQQLKKENRHDDGKLLYLGADYFLNDHNTITAAFFKNATKDHDKTSLNYDYSNQLVDSAFLRKGESWEKRSYNQLEFNYTRTFKSPKKKFSLDLQYDFWNSEKDWNLNTSRITPTAETLPGIRTSAAGASKDFLLQTDFIQPVAANSIMEFGLKLENRRVSSDYKAEEQAGNEWIIFDQIDNKLDYKELIGSGYAQFSSKWKQFSYLLGLRAELTKVRVEDAEHSFDSRKHYTKLFPTAHLGYQIQEGTSLQLSYSKRINRPSLYLLYPFNEITDFNAQYRGNPELNPSYADIFELGFLQNWGKITINPSLYYQYIAHPIQDYTYLKDGNTFITSPINIDQETRRGMELSILYQPVTSLQLNAEFNYYAFKQRGYYQAQDFNFSAQTFTSRFSAQMKLPMNFSFQGRYNYSSAERNAQSKTAAIHALDLGISKNLFKNSATVVIDGINVLNSRKFRTITTGSNYLLNQMNNPNADRYRISFVYKFNHKEGQSVRQAKSGNRN
ncbi:outer membrane beta-barrel family protein [Pedobacter gandavensis]|uniref:TonB-dependent receptor n=1 Tax=Pedobacter gandavensis TaxID=2679963 RepID=A0ABR6ESC9_9SPHI|nr:outer membrane beta-barrel family protein [Pedobacter gandavensis]MBB2148161.1 TonB-dependent receptor [Pedobacter gandavensis]